MLTNVVNIDFNDVAEAIPCYICILAMPFFYSISEGISMGVISYVVLNLITGKAKDKEDQCSDVCTGCTVYIEIYLPVRNKESEDNYKSILNRACAIKDAL